jgi:hypothetical protein
MMEHLPFFIENNFIFIIFCILTPNKWHVDLFITDKNKDTYCLLLNNVSCGFMNTAFMTHSAFPAALGPGVYSAFNRNKY